MKKKKEEEKKKKKKKKTKYLGGVGYPRTSPTPSTAPRYPCDGSLPHTPLQLLWDTRHSRPDSGLGFQAAIRIRSPSKKSVEGYPRCGLGAVSAVLEPILGTVISKN
jgi:hypothetical protein